jgi:hypothetical protein
LAAPKSGRDSLTLGELLICAADFAVSANRIFSDHDGASISNGCWEWGDDEAPNGDDTGLAG